MLPVVQLLGLEQPLHLIWHRIVRIVAKVRRDFIRTGQYRGASPARNVEHLLVRRLLRHLNGINGSHYWLSAFVFLACFPGSAHLCAPAV